MSTLNRSYNELEGYIANITDTIIEKLSRELLPALCNNMINEFLACTVISMKYCKISYFPQNKRLCFLVHFFPEKTNSGQLNDFIQKQYLYDDTSQYLHKTILYFCKRTVLKVLCYQNFYAEKDGRNVHCTNSQATVIANKGHTNVERQFKLTKGNHRNVTKVLVLCLQLLIRLFSVKRVASYCRISQIPVLVFFFQSVLLQPLEAALVRTNNKCILGFTSDNLQFVRTKAASNSCKRTLWKKKTSTGI